MSELIGTVLDERYRILDMLARGGMGAVYRAERVKLGRAMAIKFLLSWTDSAEARARFEREARAMGQLHHPNVVTVTDFGVHQGTPYLVMDFIHGIELHDLIEDGPLGAERAVAITNSVLAGLAHAHELGIVHRDIKPGNVLVHTRPGFDDEVKLLDFGVARLHDETSNLTEGMAIGTPAYMAPEQSIGAPVDARTDLYGVGVLLYQMLTGVRPYEHDDKIEVLRMHREAPRPTLDRYPDLEPVVQRAMAVDPAARFQSAADMAEALRAAVAPGYEPLEPEPEPVPTPVPPAASAPAVGAAPMPMPMPMPPQRRPRWWIGAGIGGALCILVIAMVAANSGRDRTAPPSPPSTDQPAAPSTAASDEIPGLAEAAAVAARDNRRGSRMLEDLARAYPEDARVHYQLGRAYFDRPWWPKGFEAYRDAIRFDPRLASDRAIIADALRALSSSSSHDLAERFLVGVIGDHALPALAELAEGTRNKKLAARARDVSARIRAARSTP